MTQNLTRTIVLLVLTLMVSGASYYTTDVVQEGEAHRLRESRRAAELMTARVEVLLAEEAVSAEAAEAALSRWHSRYRYIPREMNTADIVEYLERLTRVGFDQFDLSLQGRTDGPDFSTYRFEVVGTGLYAALYRLIWDLENNREFYRVNDLRMEYVEVTPEAGDLRGRVRDLVKFSFVIEAYFAGAPGISAPEDSLAPIPRGLLLPSNALRDIFDPIVRIPKDAPATQVAAPEVAASSPAASTGPARTKPPAGQRADAASPQRAADAPPDRPQLLDIDRAKLLMVAGDRALFQDDAGRRYTVVAGDPVVGGVVVELDMRGGAVVIRLGEGQDERLVYRTLGDRAPAR